MVDQRRFDNQPTLSAKEAAAFLDVKLRTLYAYVSRGLVRSFPGVDGKPRQYARADLERLRARHDARSGHGPVAAGALRWGEPVLESSLTAITPRGPVYRGHVAVDLAATGARFEAVAELIWTGTLGETALSWHAPDLGVRARRLARLLPAGAATPPLTTLALLVPALAAADDGRFDDRPDAVIARARTLLCRLAAGLAPGLAKANVAAALAAPSIAAAVAAALGARGDAAALGAIDQALIVSADHELNASSFTARVAASTGADLYACVAAALAALSGPRHGGACDRVEALVAEIGRPARAGQVIVARARRGEDVPGFGHPLYPAGDPRAVPILAAAVALAPRSPAVRTVLALIDVAQTAGREPPTVDTALVALCGALALPAGSAAGLFAVGRAAGWIGHILEQRAAGFMLRPRARYVPDPRSSNGGVP